MNNRKLFQYQNSSNGIPTGRFSNGYNAVDYLAMMMGFKESSPAYFSDDEKAKLKRGVNFASGGSGVLDATGQNKSFPMNMQILFFKKEVDRLVCSKGKEAAKLFLSRSIFIFSVTNNDLLGFYQNSSSQNSTLNDEFISSVTAQFKYQLKRIYNLGARKFSVWHWHAWVSSGKEVKPEPCLSRRPKHLVSAIQLGHEKCDSKFEHHICWNVIFQR